MAFQLSPRLIIGPRPTGPSGFELELARSDNGNATLTLRKDGAILVQQTNAGWDDAIPWASGQYNLSWNGPFAGAAHSWRMSPDPEGRAGILLHQGNQSNPTQVLEGCIGATATTLKDIYDALTNAGLDPTLTKIPLTVIGDYDFDVNLNVTSGVVKEGESSELTISISGPGAAQGVTKDLWFKLNINKNGGQGVAAFEDDFKVVPTTANGAVAPNEAGGSGWGDGVYVKLPHGQPSVTYKIDTKIDQSTEGAETIDISLVDYYVERGTAPNIIKYSDNLTQPGALLNDADTKGSVTIIDKDKLVSEYLFGGIEGVRETFIVDPGDVVAWNFEAYSIPDSLSIVSGANQDGTSGYVSGSLNGQIVAGSGEITVVVVGSQSGTAWDLALTNLGQGTVSSTLAAKTEEVALLSPGEEELISDEKFRSPDLRELFVSSPYEKLSISHPGTAAEFISFGHDTAAVEIDTNTLGFESHGQVEPMIYEGPEGPPMGSSVAASIDGATLSIVEFWNVSVPSSLESPPVNYHTEAGKDYLVRVVGQEATGNASDLQDAYLKLFEDLAGDPVLEAGETWMSSQPSIFFRSSTNTEISFVVGSDIVGRSGEATIELYDASTLQSPLLQLGRESSLSVIESDPFGGSVQIYRFGDLSSALTVQFEILPLGATSASSSDFSAGTRGEVTFAPGEPIAEIDITPVSDGLDEGSEWATISIIPASITAETVANMALLGLRNSVNIEVKDPDSIDVLSFPVLRGANAVASENDDEISFELTLSEAPSQYPVEVVYTTIGGTAVDGVDFAGTTGTLIFAPGESTKYVRVPILKDQAIEPDETVLLKILDPYGLQLEGNSVVLTYVGTISDAPRVLDPGQGQGPGFWKNHEDIFRQETGRAHEDMYEAVFGVDVVGSKVVPENPNLLQALAAGGGEEGALLRASVAAWANAVSDDVNYAVETKSLEIGVGKVFGLDPQVDDYDAKLEQAMTLVLSVLDKVDTDNDSIISGSEVIGAIRDVYSDIDEGSANLQSPNHFSWSEAGELARALDCMNNMPSVDVDLFFA